MYVDLYCNIHLNKRYGKSVIFLYAVKLQMYLVDIRNDAKDNGGRVYPAWATRAELNPLFFNNDERYLKGDKRTCVVQY